MSDISRPLSYYITDKTNSIWITGISTAKRLGFIYPQAAILVYVSPNNRFTWDRLKWHHIKLPNNWDPETVMINVDGIKQLLAAKYRLISLLPTPT